MDVFDKAGAYRDVKIAKAAGIYPYFKAITESYGPEVVMEGKRIIMVGSNNYLGLTKHPKVIAAAHAALDKFGTSCSGSRLLNGTLELHEELERKFAKFLGREAALCVSTGYTTNLASVSALLGRTDVVFSDRQNHASLLDGIRLGDGELKRYRHSDMDHLEKLLSEADDKHARMIVTDGVFSMEGDLADLPRICQLAKRYNARVMVDDAHGMGVLGPMGRGVPEHFGVEDQVDLHMGTFSKSFASLGGVIAGPAEVITYIKHKSRPFVFAASMTPAAVAACSAALDIVQEEPQRRARLWEIAEKMQRGFKTAGFDTGVSVTPVVPVFVGDPVKCFRYWKALFDAGVFTNSVIPPAVEKGHSLLRTSYMATHTDEQLDRVLDVMEQVGRKMKVIAAERPHTAVVVKVASPGKNNFLTSADKARPPPESLWANGHSANPRKLVSRIFDKVEELTWKGMNTNPEDLAKVVQLPQQAWKRRGELPSLIVEKGVSLISRARGEA